MCTTEVCTGLFSEPMMRKSLPLMVMMAFDKAVAKENMKNMPNLVACRECGVQVDMPEGSGSVLICECGAETCRLCGDASHIPLKCSEVVKEQKDSKAFIVLAQLDLHCYDIVLMVMFSCSLLCAFIEKETSARRTVEEAMTEARIRECPKCNSRFFKTEGCNNMSCGTHICYICRKNITGEGNNSHGKGYNHFCRKPHCEHKRCGNCVLFTNSVEDDRLAMKEAGLKAVEAVATGGEDEAPQIDVTALLETSTGPPRKKART